MERLCGHPGRARRRCFQELLTCETHERPPTLRGLFATLSWPMSYHVKVGEKRSKDGRHQSFVVLRGTEEHQRLHKDPCRGRLRSFSTRAHTRRSKAPLPCQAGTVVNSPYNITCREEHTPPNKNKESEWECCVSASSKRST